MKYLKLYEDIEEFDEDWEEEDTSIKFKLGDVVKMVDQNCVIVGLNDKIVLRTSTKIGTKATIIKIRKSTNFGYVFEGETEQYTGKWYLMDCFEFYGVDGDTHWPGPK